jgi:iron-sulfur cluster assembly protein
MYSLKIISKYVLFFLPEKFFCRPHVIYSVKIGRNIFFPLSLHQNLYSSYSIIIMGAVALSQVSLTDSTVRELARIKEEKSIPDTYGLRLGVKGGGCSGFSYLLGFDEAKEGDDVFEVKGIKVIMQKSHAIYLLGMEVDWADGLSNRGFVFNNPNAKETCGCGTSFSA